MFLVVNYLNPLVNTPLSFYVIVPLKCICQYTLTLKNQIWLKLLVLNANIVEMGRYSTQILIECIKRESFIILSVSQYIGPFKISLVTPLEKSFSLKINVYICER